MHAVRECGATSPASREQHAFVTALVRDEGPGDLVTVRLLDYRDVDDGPNDAVSSRPAVGSCCSRCPAAAVPPADAGFEIRHVQAMGEHYTRTIDAWAGTLEERGGRVAVDIPAEGGRRDIFRASVTTLGETCNGAGPRSDAVSAPDACR